MDQIDDLMDGEEFPLPVSITKTDFKSFDPENIDEFLFKNHRYTSIDTLNRELKDLSTELNQTLLNLVNDDYDDFINLGKSINSSHDYINYLINDLNKFKIDLVDYHDKFDQTIKTTEEIIANRTILVKIKTLAKINLLLNDLIDNFERSLESSSYNLNQLTGFFLSITKLFTYLKDQSTEHVNPFISGYLTNKISSLSLEFKSLLKECTKISKKKNDGEELLELMNIYKILGNESEFIENIKRVK